MIRLSTRLLLPLFCTLFTCLALAQNAPANRPPAVEVRQAIAGLVLDENGEAVAGATIQAFTAQGVALQPAFSDAQGRFAIGFLPPKVSFPDFYVVQAKAPDFPPAYALASQTGDETVTIRLGQNAPLRLRVQDEAGKPVEGAKITPTQRTLPRIDGRGNGVLPAVSLGGIEAVETNAAGDATFPALPHQGAIELKIAHPNWATNIVTVDLPKTEVIDVKLERAASFGGRVFLGDEPMLGLPLQIKMQALGGPFARAVNWRGANVREDGTFLVKNLPSLEQMGVDRYSWHLEHIHKQKPLPGGATYSQIGGFTALLTLPRNGRTERWASFLHTDLVYKAGEQVKLDIHLVPYALVRGQIPEAEKLQGAIEFEVRDPRSFYGGGDRFRPDANGAFSRPIPTGDVSIRVKRNGRIVGYLHVEALEPHEERDLIWKLESEPLQKK